MKKKPIGLQRKLFLDKETIATLNATTQGRIRGGNLVQAPVNDSLDYRRCTTTIEQFRLSMEIQCNETEVPALCHTRVSYDIVCPIGG